LLLPLLVQQGQERSRVINVSSGGMYSSRLDVSDLQSEKTEPFNGAGVYAHEKRQMVIWTAEMAKKYPQVLFFSTHPGWVDTPGVEKSIPDFHRNLKNQLRTVQQGVDTMMWLGMAEEKDVESGNGKFWFDREVVREHLPLAGTQPSEADVQSLLTQLEELSQSVLDVK